MTVFLSQQEAGLAVASLLSLGVLCVMCLSCRKKPRIIREENVIYGQELVRGGRRFTVLRSKTVQEHITFQKRALQVRLSTTPGDLPPTPRELGICATAAAADDQPNYQNIPKSPVGEFDNMYVNPIPNLVYQNVTAGQNKDEDAYSYENVFPTLENAVNADSDSSDYANTSFLEEMKQEEEPDYVNTEENNT